MSTIFIQKKIRIPSIGTWDWKQEDCEIPLVFSLAGAKAFLFLEAISLGHNEKRSVVLEAILQIRFSPPPQKILRGLKTSGKQSIEVANQIYSYYREVIEKFEGLIRTTANVKYLMPDESPMEMESFFGDDRFHGEEVTWWVDSQTPVTFRPKITGSRQQFNPLFKRDQLIDRNKWTKMQKALELNEYPSDEMMELLRIRSQLAWRSKKVATIESAVFAETILRNYAVEVLLSQGISKTRLQGLRDNLSFNLMLNAVLPLTLTKTEAKKLENHITAVDILRKIRNDVVHGNIEEKDIDESAVRNGIESTLKIVETIKSKLKGKT